MLRVTPGGDFYYFWIQTGTPVGIFRRVSNAYTQVGGNGASVPTGPFKCRMEAQGTTLRMYIDGALWLTVTDPGGIATGQPGILGNGPGVLDNFRAGDLPYTPAVVPTSDTFTYADGPLATVGATNWQDTALGPGSGEGMLYPANVFSNRVRNLNPSGPSYGNN